MEKELLCFNCFSCVCADHEHSPQMGKRYCDHPIITDKSAFCTFRIKHHKYCLQPYTRKYPRKAMEKENSAISEQNARIYEIIDELKQRILPLQKRYAERIAPWYPQNYCSVDAVGFFVDAVQNYRANTVSEAVNLYEDALHKRKMERGQEQIAKQQRISAMLQVGALMMQGATIDAINRNTDAVNNPQFVKDYYKRSSGTSW